MTTYHRFRDLTARGYFNNRMTLKRATDAGRFPPPLDFGPNTRAWTDKQLAEVDARIAAGIADQPNPKWLAEAAKVRERRRQRMVKATAQASPQRKGRRARS